MAGILESAVAADPILCRHAQRVNESKQQEIKAFCTALGVLSLELDADNSFDSYEAMNAWELDQLALHATAGVGLVGLALVREEVLTPYDLPDQEKRRAQSTLAWLRARLGAADSN